MTACINKIWFPSIKAAKQRVRIVKTRCNKKLKAYKCPHCDGYHMTSKLSMAYTIKARRNK